MQKVSELVSSSIGDTLTNVKTWKNVMYNVLEHGLVGDGVTDDTAALQTLINTAIAEGRRTIFFPHTSTGGEYYVTSLTNANQVDFVGDNCSFVGGYTGTISNIGGIPPDVVRESQRYAPIYDPIYDLALGVLSSTIYNDLGSFSIPSGKKWYVNDVTGTNDSTGDGYLRAFSWDLTAGANTTGDSVRGAIGSVKSSGASNVKSVQGTAQGLTGHTGVLVGVVGEVMPAATTSQSWAYQATVGDKATAAMVINGVLNNGTEHTQFGIYNYNSGLNFDTAFINYDAMGSGDFLRMRNQAGSTTLFRVASDGNVYLASQKSANFNNTTRDFQIQAVTTGDYVRILAGGAGDIVRFGANFSTTFMGVAVLKNYSSGALPSPATYPNGIATYGASKIPIYCDGTSWRKMSDDTVVT